MTLIWSLLSRKLIRRPFAASKYPPATYTAAFPGRFIYSSFMMLRSRRNIDSTSIALPYILGAQGIDASHVTEIKQHRSSLFEGFLRSLPWKKHRSVRSDPGEGWNSALSLRGVSAWLVPRELWWQERRMHPLWSTNMQMRCSLTVDDKTDAWRPWGRIFGGGEVMVNKSECAFIYCEYIHDLVPAICPDISVCMRYACNIY
ncbi:hypothetical protein CEXT_464031 [Caerostris extrusa]|uniref:Uncharacterized protein n=1 Tax=Caerostris extrusa TaxID=172846 RepID=A0AAV4M4G8_CAEEX|nr:hypothetical protein CEXT_464031 [Caerostris extrusa]